MDPVLLHSGDEPERRHRHLVRLLAQLELVREPHHEEARVHGRNVDAQSLEFKKTQKLRWCHKNMKPQSLL